ncbi:inactive protein RESTRICTED TEV MOVEMENT 2-like [Momordica charantia]|uniref:Inactive protein RESTRICTED TEV MOVEMENT 2-like n=1 Tax=Momordica charantia TaxID=3673 RepID=A0A6J1DIF9_MOMCH|nr:inactive protein RESTRICTED TEV MOVEMENT 2-like [Momordica charantia]
MLNLISNLIPIPPASSIYKTNPSLSFLNPPNTPTAIKFQTMAVNRQRTYEDFEPPVESSQEDGCSILTIYLPGFSKEQIRVQVSSTGKLRISGERPYRNKAWQRFHKEFQIPPNCDTSSITAKYKGGILHVRQPLREESKQQAAEAPKAQPPEQQSAKQKQAEAPEKKSNVAADGTAEARISKETTNALEDNADKARKDAQEHPNIRDKIMSQAGRLKEMITGNMVKLILPILLAALLFLYAKRLNRPCLLELENLHSES